MSATKASVRVRGVPRASAKATNSAKTITASDSLTCVVIGTHGYRVAVIPEIEKTHQSGGIKEHRLSAFVRACVFAGKVRVDPFVVSRASVATVPGPKVSLDARCRLCFVFGQGPMPFRDSGLLQTLDCCLFRRQPELTGGVYECLVNLIWNCDRYLMSHFLACK